MIYGSVENFSNETIQLMIYLRRISSRVAYDRRSINGVYRQKIAMDECREARNAKKNCFYLPPNELVDEISFFIRHWHTKKKTYFLS